MRLPEDYRYMRMALRQALKGQGRTSPNPCVGAVVVRDGRVVGSGYHRKAGTPHAEVNALAAAGDLAEGATIYITLEPCNHHGRTPPCTRALLEAGIKRVVVGMTDPNPAVAGGGCGYLADRGIEIETGVLERACMALNYPFIKHSCREGIPWVVMKAGMSLDGRITYRRGQGGRITGEESRLHTHRLRDRLDAIMIGVETALIDDPALTTRLPDDEERPGRDPLRIVLDSTLRLSPEAKLVRQHSNAATWVLCGPRAAAAKKEALEEAGVRVEQLALTDEGRLDLEAVLRLLGREGILSVLVEGGATLHGALLRQGLVDQIYLYMAPFFIGEDGIPLVEGYAVGSADQAVRLVEKKVVRLGDDLLIQGLLNRKIVEGVT